MSTAATPTALNGQGLHTRLPQAVEKKRLGVERRATPDSEALLSSDDDHEPSSTMSMSLHSAQSLPAHRPIRRASWLSEVRTAQRKYSLGGHSLASASGNSQPPTPSAENGHTLERLGSQGQLGSSLSHWETAPARPAASQNSPNLWGAPTTAHIWSKKDAPRWNDFSTSPSLSHSTIDDLRSPTAPSAGEAGNATSVSSIPFDIPLEPNRKTVRSQSYSAGQLDLPLGNDPYNRFKTKRILPPSLSRRKSRTVMADSTSEFDLASVQEDTADSMDFPHPDALPGGGVRLFPSPRSERVNVASPSSYNTGQDVLQHSPGSMAHTEDELPQTPHGRLMRPSQEFQTSMQSTQVAGGASLQQRPAPESATDTNDPFSDSMVTLNIQRAAREAQDILSRAEGTNRPYFGGEGASAQPSLATQQAYANASRLHSLGRPSASEYRNTSVERSLSFSDPWPNSANAAHPAESETPTPTTNKPDAIYMGGNPNAYDFDADFRATPYHNQADPQHFLYIVTFKSSRADVYWIPENFGTAPKVGDMVVVEGDRGDDLGMVAHVNLTFAQAKLLKKDYNRKHYKVLVQFARIFRNLQDTLPHHDDYDNVSGYNLGDQNHATRKNPNPQPKLIKRIATDREIMLLREKEGNEARAKRICQGKINQHRLNMEILDAEFQLDYRKLTFYFYAENYINFNNIVVDLFKVWKTRIWLSAVNPETYPAPPSRPGDRTRRNPSSGTNRGGMGSGNSANGAGNEDREQDVRSSTAYMMGVRDIVTGQFPAALAASFMNPNMQQMSTMGQPNQGFNTFQSYNYANQAFAGNNQFPNGMPMQNQPTQFQTPQMTNVPGVGSGNAVQASYNAASGASQGGNLNSNGNGFNHNPFAMGNSFGSTGPSQGNFGMNTSFSAATSLGNQNHQAQFAMSNTYGNYPMGYNNNTASNQNAYGGFPYANTMTSPGTTTSATSPPTTFPSPPGPQAVQGLQTFGNRRELPPAFIPRSQQPINPVSMRHDGSFSRGQRNSPASGMSSDNLAEDLDNMHLDQSKQRRL